MQLAIPAILSMLFGWMPITSPNVVTANTTKPEKIYQCSHTFNHLHRTFSASGFMQTDKLVTPQFRIYLFQSALETVVVIYHQADIPMNLFTSSFKSVCYNRQEKWELNIFLQEREGA